MGRIVEGFWDCPYCGKTGIRGGIMECPTCGKVRDSSTKFYLNKNNMRYLSDEERKKVSNGPDWFCPYCQSYNRSDATICAECGHPKDAEDLDYFQIQEKNREYEKKQREYSQPQPQYESKSEHPVNNYQPASDTHYEESSPFKNIGIGAAVIAFICLMLFFFVPKETTFELNDIYWKYGVAVEEYRTVDESGWSIPSGGRLHYSQEEIYTYQQVLDHYETKTRQVSEQVLDGYDTVVTGHRDMGNGYFEEITSQVPRYRTEYHTETYQEPVYKQVPIYKTKYYYEIDKWVYDRTLTTEGNTKDTYFEDYTPEENERFGKKSKKYVFYGVVDGENKDMQVEEHIWDKYNVGDIIPIKINRAGIITIIEESSENAGFASSGSATSESSRPGGFEKNNKVMR